MHFLIKNAAGKHNFQRQSPLSHFAEMQTAREWTSRYFIYVLITPSAYLSLLLHLKLIHFLRQSFYAVFVFAGKAVHFLHGAVYLLNTCRHFVHAVFYDGGELV